MCFSYCSRTNSNDQLFVKNATDRRQTKLLTKVKVLLVCPFCGHKASFLYMPLFILLGASGTGKSTIYHQLLQNIPECVILESDFLIDSIGQLVPKSIWRVLKWFSKLALPTKTDVIKQDGKNSKEQTSIIKSLNKRFVHSYRNIWLRIAKNIHQSGRSVVLLVRATPDHFEDCPERSYFSAIHYAALVCSEEELTKRIGNRYPDILTNMLVLNRWFKAQAETHNPPISLIDTTHKSPEETSLEVIQWIRQHLESN